MEATTQTPARAGRDTCSEEVLCSKCQEPVVEDSESLLDRTEIKHEPKDESLSGIKATKVTQQSEKVLQEFDEEAMMHSDGEGEAESEDNMDDTSQDLALDLPRHFMSVSPRGKQNTTQLSFAPILPNSHSQGLMRPTREVRRYGSVPSAPWSTRDTPTSSST